MILFWAVESGFFSHFSVHTAYLIYEPLSKVSGGEGINVVFLTLMCYKSNRQLPEDGLYTRRNASDLWLKSD